MKFTRFCKPLSLLLVISAILFISIAAFRNYESVKDLRWGFDGDCYRDLSNSIIILEGNYGQDANLVGEWMWYNPLISFFELFFIRLFSFNAMTFMTQGGVVLNLFGAIAFFVMVRTLFNNMVAIGALVSFLFFSMLNLLSSSVASYAPWLYPVTFTQCFFYVSVIAFFNFLEKLTIRNSFLLGLLTGITFLGHTAPALIIVVMIFCITVSKIISALKSKNKKATKQWITLSFVCGITFIIVTLPFTWFIVFKYHLKMVNHYAFGFTGEDFLVQNFFILLKKNVSVFSLIAIAGFLYFILKFKKSNTKTILIYWLATCIALYCYTTSVNIIKYIYHVQLPGIVPSFHFFFYIKALQSVFFGYACYLFIEFALMSLNKHHVSIAVKEKFLIVLLVAMVLIYYPVYSTRADFKVNREFALMQNQNAAGIDMYEWILKNTATNDVILCDNDLANFPVLATGRKMVCVSPTMMNPYVDYDKRNEERNKMIECLNNGSAEMVKDLFSKYHPKFLLINKSMPTFNALNIEKIFGTPIYINTALSMFDLDPAQKKQHVLR